MRIQQSVCIPMIKPQEIALEPFVAQVAEMGYKAIEIWGPDDTFAEVLRLAHRYNLAIPVMVGHAGIDSGLNDLTQHARIVAELRQSIDIAADSGIKALICFSGTRRPGLSEEVGILNTVVGFKQIAPYAEQKGVTLVLELLNSRYDHPAYQADHAAWGVSVCQQVASPRVKLLYDIYHMQIMDGDIVRSVTGAIDLIGHFHTGGVPGRADIDSTQELNYAAVCQAIARTGYSGYLAHEYRPAGDVYASLRTAFKICDQS
jgi:hydroxypyruvate isomerase